MEKLIITQDEKENSTIIIEICLDIENKFRILSTQFSLNHKGVAN